MAPYNKDSNSPAATPTTNQLASQVDETRSAITSDIKELGDKVSPAQLKEEAKKAGKELATSAQEAVVEKAIEVKDAVVDKAVEVKNAVVDKAVEASDVAVEKLGEAKEVVSEALDEASDVAARWGTATWRFTKANAVPLALIGLGASWIIGTNARAATAPTPRRSQPRATRRIVADRTRRVDDDWQPDALDDDWHAEDRLASEGNPLAGSANNGKRKPATALRGAQREADDLLQRGKQQADDLLQRGKEQAVRGARLGRERLVQAKDASLDFAEANPLGVALTTLAIGIGVGLLLPTTKAEERLLAPTREKFDRLVGDAREVANDVVELAKETADETLAKT